MLQCTIVRLLPYSAVYRNEHSQNNDSWMTSSTFSAYWLMWVSGKTLRCGLLKHLIRSKRDLALPQTALRVRSFGAEGMVAEVVQAHVGSDLIEHGERGRLRLHGERGQQQVVANSIDDAGDSL